MIVEGRPRSKLNPDCTRDWAAGWPEKHRIQETMLVRTDTSLDLKLGSYYLERNRDQGTGWAGRSVDG